MTQEELFSNDIKPWSKAEDNRTKQISELIYKLQNIGDEFEEFYAVTYGNEIESFNIELPGRRTTELSIYKSYIVYNNNWDENDKRVKKGAKVPGTIFYDISDDGDVIDENYLGYKTLADAEHAAQIYVNDLKKSFIKESKDLCERSSVKMGMKDLIDRILDGALVRKEILGYSVKELNGDDSRETAIKESYESFHHDVYIDDNDVLDEAADADMDAVRKTLSILDAKCAAIKAQDIYDNTPKFQALVKLLKESYDQVGSFLIRLFFENRQDEAHSHGISLDNNDGDLMTITKWEGAGGRVVKKVSAVRYKTACSVFKENVDLCGQNYGNDKKKIFASVAYNIYFQYRNTHHFDYHMKNPYYKDDAAVQSLEQSLKALETADYQGRNGDYPSSGVPDTIDVHNNDITFVFKNTSESTAQSWVERYLKNKGFKVGRISAYQTGDYQDDWVDVSAHVDGFLNESKISNGLKSASVRKEILDYDASVETVIKESVNDLRDYFKVGNTEYRILIKGADVWVTKVVHYDLADYYWAVSHDGGQNFNICLDNKVKSKYRTKSFSKDPETGATEFTWTEIGNVLNDYNSKIDTKIDRT